MKRQRSQEEKPALDLVEEAVHLLRHGPAAGLAAYYFGSLPFVLALLYFWSDMAHSAFASERLTVGSLALTALFFWMKTWQGVAAQHWLAEAGGTPPPGWRAGWFAETAVRQAAIQPIGLFLLPICLVLLVPFGWAYAFFANATVFSGAPAANHRAFLARSWRQAKLWPLQNHYVLFMFKFFGLFVLLNLFSAVLAVPFALKSLLGIESAFTQSPWAAFNSTLIAALIGLAWLCLDPIVKATYALRCFYGESLHTGADLRAELKANQTGKLAAAALVLVACLLTGTTTSRGQDGDRQPATRLESNHRESDVSLSPPALDRSIEKTIQKREYSWRLPRDQLADDAGEKDRNWLDRFFKNLEDGFKAMGRWISDGIEWLINKLRPRGGPNPGSWNFASAMSSLLFVLVAVLIGVAMWLLYRIWQRRNRSEEVEAQAVPAVPDLSDENVGAEQLPEDGWTRLARELMEKGELRLALRALYLATLAHLATRNLIMLAKFKSNRDYEREVGRRGHALGELVMLFGQNVSVFERVWYGLHEVTADMVSDFSRNVERMRSGA